MRHVTQFIPFAVDSKTWCVEAISASVARPAQCPCCGIAGRVPGRRLMLHGHGRRQRHQRGPELPEQTPDTRVVLLRRYRCLGCGAMMCVGPRGNTCERSVSEGGADKCGWCARACVSGRPLRSAWPLRRIALRLNARCPTGTYRQRSEAEHLHWQVLWSG